VESSRISLISRTVFEVLDLCLEGLVLDLVLGLEPSGFSKIGLSSVEDSSFYLAFKPFFRNAFFLVAMKT